MASLQQWAHPRLQTLLPLGDAEIDQIVSHTATLPDAEATLHLQNLLGSSPEALKFITSFIDFRSQQRFSQPQGIAGDVKAPPEYQPEAFWAAKGYTNAVIKAGQTRAVDEQNMRRRRQELQYYCKIYNSEILPEHFVPDTCTCPIHQFKAIRMQRLGVQEMWCKAVMYPGEKFYTDLPVGMAEIRNPFSFKPIGSPYGTNPHKGIMKAKPIPYHHVSWLEHVIALNTQFDSEAQAHVDSEEPSQNIWADGVTPADKEKEKEKGKSKFSLKHAFGIQSSDEKAAEKARMIRTDILLEEKGRWPDEQHRQLVAAYQDKMGISDHVADLRAHRPLQYLHLLRAGYFEPIPVAWANEESNPLQFVIESLEGWRGITPTWRGYKNLAEERLYWVLNHRSGVRRWSKPNRISALRMARERMARAVELPPIYFSQKDTSALTGAHGYSKQIQPTLFRAYDKPETPADNTMILLDVSGSMDSEPVRAIYDKYMITGYMPSMQPRNKDVARAIVHRFIDAMENHDHQPEGCDLVTFADAANYVGTVNRHNYEQVWQQQVRFGRGTRIMAGWQMVKDLHFQTHNSSAYCHPLYGWQAGPDTPKLRLLLLLNSEAVDMNAFELDLLGLSWAHVTICLIGVEGCPHHHRHANELERISQTNPHVSFVDVQGNCPERYVTHELLKRHLGYDMSLQEFADLEAPPGYDEAVDAYRNGR